MKRHAFDLTSFVFGVVLAAAAAGFLLADQLRWDVDGRWILPAALILLGIAGLAGALSGIRSTRTTDDTLGATATTDVDQPTAVIDGDTREHDGEGLSPR
jgi:hypothetical protein